jgi:FMN phosphatase YigB (HAD superfamily)
MRGIKIVSFDLEGTLTTPDFSQAVWYERIPSLYSELHNITPEEAQAIVRKTRELPIHLETHSNCQI